MHVSALPSTGEHVRLREIGSGINGVIAELPGGLFFTAIYAKDGRLIETVTHDPRDTDIDRLDVIEAGKRLVAEHANADNRR